MSRKLKDYILISLKGMGMGAADVVPGVSGGTIAFITGIYEELIHTIKSVNINSLKLLLQFKLKEFWKAVNGNFLSSLIIGIIFSFLTLAKAIKYLLTNEPILIWSFFFGLIVASAIIVARKISNWKLSHILALLGGITVAYWVTVITPAETSTAYWFLFLSGALAICAMILPGISGAFILLLLGKYEYILHALSTLQLDVILIVGVGAIVGLLSFSNILSWLLKNYHNLTIALLSGFMIGSLNKVWPWKETISTFTNRHGIVKPLLQENILPGTYEQIMQQDSQLIYSIILAVTGFLLIYALEKFSLDKE